MTAPDRHAAHRKLRAELLLWLGSRPWCRVWGAQAGLYLTRQGAPISIGQPGQGDLTGILRGGRRLEVEIKTGQGAQRKAQRIFGRVIDEFGGVYIVARSVDDCREQLAEAGYRDAP